LRLLRQYIQTCRSVEFARLHLHAAKTDQLGVLVVCRLMHPQAIKIHGVPALSDNRGSKMEQLVETLLRSAARASGAMQNGLDDLASSRSGLGAFDPFVWIKMAKEVALAAIASPSRPRFPEFDKSIPQSPRPASRLVLVPQLSGCGDHPFRVPAPPVASAARSAPAATPPARNRRRI
jgi:hypothetical protein